MGWSKLKAGRGVFTTQDLKQGEVIEYAPVILIDKQHSVGTINDYVYTHGTDESKLILVLGYASLYNHDDENNVEHSFDADNLVFTMTAKRDIKKGEELCVTYGSEWWVGRPHINKI